MVYYINNNIVILRMCCIYIIIYNIILFYRTLLQYYTTTAVLYIQLTCYIPRVTWAVDEWSVQRLGERGKGRSNARRNYYRSTSVSGTFLPPIAGPPPVKTRRHSARATQFVAVGRTERRVGILYIIKIIIIFNTRVRRQKRRKNNGHLLRVLPTCS